MPNLCDADTKRGTGTGVCNRVLDDNGYCDRASDHITDDDICSDCLKYMGEDGTSCDCNCPECKAPHVDCKCDDEEED